jgi:hypothetical protein
MGLLLGRGAEAADSLLTALPVDTVRSGAGILQGALELGLENVSVDSTTTPPNVAYENRRYRHTLEALARLEGVAGGRIVGFERRLGLTSAAITRTGPDDDPRFHVLFPSDRGFPSPPRGRPAARTSRNVDLVFGPLIMYELGRVYAPVQFQFAIEPRIRYNPWTGARATASMVIPLYNDFPPSDIHPDIDVTRPGLLTLEQYAWVPRAALLSGTAGVFGDNRYGFSMGAARPFAEGAVVLDAQADYTGYIGFPSEGAEYSELSTWSSFAGVTWNAPWFDASLRFRIAQFLYGDQGEELQFTRWMGDVGVSVFVLRSDGIDVQGIRFNLPIPPMTRSTHHRVRVQPIERFPISYRTEAEVVGTHLSGVASREEFLRQLPAPSLNANLDRYFRARGEKPQPPPQAPPAWISTTGMTGFINTPWAGVIPDRGIELSYSFIPSEWAYNDRDIHDNVVYALSLGILPRTEASLRFTRIPGKQGFNDDPDNQLDTDTDHMASGRLTLLTPGDRKPGLAIGVEDIEGTRRFHSAYAVTGTFFSIFRVQSRLSLGYAFDVFTATRLVLDGGFGAIEVSPWRAVAARVEYDTEKWNGGIGVELGFGFRLHAAMLNMESLSIGGGWHHEL